MTNTDPPVWLLDVDGVINAWGPYAASFKKNARWFNPYWGGEKMHKGEAMCQGKEWTVRWSPSLIRRINEAHDTGQVEIRWCSTWNSDTADLARMLGLPPDLPIAFNTRGMHWREIANLKRRNALAILADGRPLIWTDDNEVPFTWELSHATMTAGGNALLIRPKEALGLLPGDMDEIDLFIQRHAHYPVDPEIEQVMP